MAVLLYIVNINEYVHVTMFAGRYTALPTASVVNANSWPAIHMKLRFCIAKVRTRNNCNIYVCIRSGSSLSCARRQISYATIARGNHCGRGNLFSVSRVFFFATFPERFTSRQRQTTGPFWKELKSIANIVGKNLVCLGQN